MSPENLKTAHKLRIRHTMLRVADLEKSVDFYTRLLGMDLMRRRENARSKTCVGYVGYGEESTNHALELIQEQDHSGGYSHDDAYGHIAIAVKDMYGLCEGLKTAGVEFISGPGQNRPDNPNLFAFIKDPDGYEIELTENMSS